MDYEHIEHLRERHTAWALLASDNVALVLSFLDRMFIDANASNIPSFLPPLVDARSRGGQGDSEVSLMLVLDGNNPRFPWEPSTTMLTYRLEGTTEAPASHRDGPDHPVPPTDSPLASNACPRHLRSPRRAPEGALRC
jgi:hypothetical protein